MKKTGERKRKNKYFIEREQNSLLDGKIERWRDRRRDQRIDGEKDREGEGRMEGCTEEGCKDKRFFTCLVVN